MILKHIMFDMTLTLQFYFSIFLCRHLQQPGPPPPFGEIMCFCNGASTISSLSVVYIFLTIFYLFSVWLGMPFGAPPPPHLGGPPLGMPPMNFPPPPPSAFPKPPS